MVLSVLFVLLNNDIRSKYHCLTNLGGYSYHKICGLYARMMNLISQCNLMISLPFTNRKLVK